MADTKITALAAITTVAPANDLFAIVDVSDNSMAASGTTKNITTNQILGAGGTATLASATISGDLTVDTSTLKVDSANDRVGIGIATPSWTLDIRSATAVAQILSTTGTNAAYLQVSNTGGIFYLGRENSAGTSFASPAYSAVLYAAGAYPLVTTVNGSERYRIASDGVATWSNVGGVAGTAMTLNSTGLGVGVAPNRNLDIRQDQSAATIARIQNQSVNAAAYSELNLSASGNNWGIRTGSTAANSNRLEFVVDPSGTNLSVMRLDTSGNVGVGVAPSAIAGATRVEIKGSNRADLCLRSGSANASARDWMVASNVIAFGDFVVRQGASQGAEPNSGTDRMYFDPSGNIIITPTSAPPTLTVNGQIAINATSNTNLRFSYRGSDGTTRVANITLA